VITPELWESKPVTLQHVRFTGWDGDGNGYELLDWLHQHGVDAVRGQGDEHHRLYIVTAERPDAFAEPGWWFVVGTRNEIYPVRPDVHDDRFRPASPLPHPRRAP
jgi:hypothetical protein